jgi:hypothetical protein
MVEEKAEIVHGYQALALELGKSKRQVYRYLQEPSFPRLPGRRFDLAAVRAWLARSRGERQAGPGPHLNFWKDLPELAGEGIAEMQRGLNAIFRTAQGAARPERELLLIAVGLELLAQAKLLGALLRAWQRRGPGLFDESGA